MIHEYKVPVRYLFSLVKYELALILLFGLSTRIATLGFTSYLPTMPLAIPAFLGTSISVLLSFKMNQSYDRWWEGRKIWGAILNDSRNLIIQLQSFTGIEQAQHIKRIAYRQIAWNYVFGRSLRGLDPLEGSHSLFSETELTRISNEQNKSLAMLQSTSEDIQHLYRTQAIGVYEHVHLQKIMISLTDSMGSAERIKRTVFPSTYRLVLHFIIYLFVITLTIALKDISNKLVAPLLVLISIGFFLIEKIAYHLQDPFRNRPSDVPLTDIAKTAERNIRQLLGEEAKDKAVDPDSYFVM